MFANRIVNQVGLKMFSPCVSQTGLKRYVNNLSLPMNSEKETKTETKTKTKVYLYLIMDSVGLTVFGTGAIFFSSKGDSIIVPTIYGTCMLLYAYGIKQGIRDLKLLRNKKNDIN